MAILPSISFELEIAPLQPKNTQGIPAGDIPKELPPVPPDPVTGAAAQRFVPLGLRWRLKPELGIPRQPFFLWRRNKAKGDPVDLQFTPTQAAGFMVGNGIFSITGKPFYILLITVTNNDPTNSIAVQALNMTLNPIILQSVNLPPNKSATIRFQHPFIGGFSIKGNFTLKGITGVTMKHFIERPEEWELIQIVGLPAKQNEIPGYDPAQQGYVSQLGDPVDNAIKRLKVAQHFYLPLATALPSGMQVPVWEIPDAGEAVDELRKGSPPLLERIGKMFKAVDDGEVHEQADFRATETVPGIHQPEFPGQATPDATIDMPLLATVLINVITDPWFSLASGFGATDFPLLTQRSERFIEPPSYFNVSHDYMVTSKFVFRFEGEVFTDPEYTEEYCALSHKSVVPTLPVTGLESSVFSLNRPPHRDEPWSVEGALTWTKLNHFQIQGNAIAVAESGSNGLYLNTLRPAAVAHQPALFVPMKPGDTSDPVLISKNRFIHSQTLLPFKDSRVNQYGVASMDSFGRWSDWKETQLTLTARQPESPRLMALSMTPDKSRINGNTCPHELSLEILWDWQDRSPKIFQLAAVFHRRLYFPDGTKDNGHIPPTGYPAIFQTDNTVNSGVLPGLIFKSDIPPGTPPEFTAAPSFTGPGMTIELLPQAVNQNNQNVDGEMLRYRVRVRDINMTFNPDEEWYFTAFVKAAEWRNPLLFSDSVLPLAPGRPPKLTTFVPNPIPAPPPVFIPPTIIWAPMPDARGISRFRLSFDKIPAATGGYAVYRAFEAKIRDKAGLPVRSDTDLIGRATDLRDIAMPLEQCLDAFTRLNDKLIPPPPGTTVEFETEIPGTMDGLMAFAVVSVTREQEVSALSKPWLFVAVPRRAVPGLPLLSLQQQNTNVTLACEFPKAPKPSLVEIFRSRKEVTANDVDTMVPVLEVLEADWQALDERGKPVSDLSQLHHFHFSVNDPTPPSWFPYFYRAASTGLTDPVNGLIAGRSQQSNLVKAEKLPPTLPEITDAKAEQKTSTSVIVSFKSDAILEVTPHGSFRMEMFSWDFTAKKFNDNPVPAVFLKQALPGVPSPEKETLYFSEPDANQRRTFQVLMNVTGSAFLFKIRLYDPLGRASERMVSGELTASFNPDLSNPRASKSGKDLLVFFESTTPFIPPLLGDFKLEITFVGPHVHGGLLLMRIGFSQIQAGVLAKLPLSQVTRIMRDSKGHLPQPIKYGAIFKNFYPAIGFPPLHGVIRIRLTAPDNTVALVTVNI
jgi:hypothetical protein